MLEPTLIAPSIPPELLITVPPELLFEPALFLEDEPLDELFDEPLEELSEESSSDELAFAVSVVAVWLSSVCVSSDAFCASSCFLIKAT